MVFYIGAQGGLKTLAMWPKDPGVFSVYRSIDRGYLHYANPNPTYSQGVLP